MIIGIDASRANKKRKTGTEWYSYYLIRHFAEIDDKNEYILYSDEPFCKNLLDLGGCDNKSGEKKEGEYVNIKSPHNNFKGKILKWPMKYFWTQGRLSLEMLFNKPDVLFVPSHSLPLISPKKSIATIHDIGFEKNADLYRSDMIGPENKYIKKIINFLARLVTLGKYTSSVLDYLRWSTAFTLKKAEKIISVSHFTKSELVKLYNADSDKIRVVHNGYNVDLYKKYSENEQEEVKRKYGIEGSFFLYIGRLEKKKNTPALIEAFAFLKDKKKDLNLKLVLIGEASYGYDEVNYMIREFGLDNDVIITGWIPEVDIPKICSAATAFIFPSMYEGFGIPLLQAMSCEVPVAASDISSIPEVVGDAALLFSPTSVFSISRAMEKIYEDEGLRNDLIEKGKRRVGDFSWRICAEETLAELLNKKKNSD